MIAVVTHRFWQRKNVQCHVSFMSHFCQGSWSVLQKLSSRLVLSPFQNWLLHVIPSRHVWGPKNLEALVLRPVGMAGPEPLEARYLWSCYHTNGLLHQIMWVQLYCALAAAQCIVIDPVCGQWISQRGTSNPPLLPPSSPRTHPLTP